MKLGNQFKLFLSMGLVAVASSAFAMTEVTAPFQSHPFYVSLNAGLFQGNFNTSYIDQTDLIQQNISQSSQQYGYTQGIAVGYSKLFRNQYLFGAELAGSLNSHQSKFASGAASAAFSDTTQINRNVDLTFVPGVLLTDTLAAYLKLGVSIASVQDTLISPVGYTPTMTRFTNNTTVTGFAAGLGVKKYVTDHVSLFAEGNYHDYGTVNFAAFQNFSANYTHTSRLYSYSILVGASYSI